MKGRSKFTADEVEVLRRLIREKQTAERARQKVLRRRMRAMGFHIRDYTDESGFTVSDLDDLLARGVVEIVSSRPERVNEQEE